MNIEEIIQQCELRNQQLQSLADTMKSYSETGGDHHWLAAMAIERLLMMENLYLVSGRCVGDDDDTVALVEGDSLEPFYDEIQAENPARVYIIYHMRLAHAVDMRLKAKDEPTKAQVSERGIFNGN